MCSLSSQDRLHAWCRLIYQFQLHLSLTTILSAVWEIKMSDLQCQKFYFGGHKMRILGKVSLTVQTVLTVVVLST